VPAAYEFDLEERDSDEQDSYQELEPADTGQRAAYQDPNSDEDDESSESGGKYQEDFPATHLDINISKFKDWLIELRDLKFGEVLGEGAFGRFACRLHCCC